jgi:hypothetical protein
MIGNINWMVLVNPICKSIEHEYNVKLKVDIDALMELGAIAAKTIGGYDIRHPNPAKVAGHIVFWFRRIKPLSFSDDTPAKCFAVNEMTALWLGLAICNTHRGNESKEVLRLPPRIAKDWIFSLRYNSHSPHALATAFELFASDH